MTAFERSTMYDIERISAAHRDWMWTGSRSVPWKPWHTLKQRAITPAAIAEAFEVLRSAIGDSCVIQQPREEDRMKNQVKKNIEIVPANFTSVTPWIVSSSTSKMIDFLTNAFEAEEIPHSRIKNKEGVVINAVVKIGTAMVMLFDSREGWSPTPSLLNMYVEDVEKVYRASLELGATSVTDITTMYFGEKVCRILDPFGNLWWLNQRVEEIEPAEIKRRAATPEAAKGIAYIQKSLNEALRAQKAFFAEAA